MFFIARPHVYSFKILLSLSFKKASILSRKNLPALFSLLQSVSPILAPALPKTAYKIRCIFYQFKIAFLFSCFSLFSCLEPFFLFALFF